MRYKVIRLRDSGWVLPKFRLALVGAMAGNLVIHDHNDSQMHRVTRRAELLDITTGQPLEKFPPLYDVTLIHMAHGYMTLTGFERIAQNFGDRFHDYAQTWLVEPVDVAD